MRRITESAIGLAFLGLTLVLGIAGLVSDLLNQGDPPAFYGAAVVTAIAAIAVALDEHHRTPGKYRWSEAFLGRGLIGLAVIFEVVSFILAIGDSSYRNLWLVFAVVVELVGLTAVLDSHRLAVARVGAIATRNLADGILGAICAAVGLGLGTVGLASGLVDNTHAPAMLHAGVVFALLAVALMFDEQAHIVSRVRKKR